jgi:hypothetical protein
MTARYRAASAVAPTLGVTIQPLPVREPDDFDAAFSAMNRERPDGILLVTDVLTILFVDKILRGTKPTDIRSNKPQNSILSSISRRPKRSIS